MEATAPAVPTSFDMGEFCSRMGDNVSNFVSDARVVFNDGSARVVEGISTAWANYGYPLAQSIYNLVISLFEKLSAQFDAFRNWVENNPEAAQTTCIVGSISVVVGWMLHAFVGARAPAADAVKKI